MLEEFLNDYANTDNPYKTEVQNKIAKYTFNWENGVFVEGGSFDMGDNKWDYTKPIHKVTVSSFYMSKYETTEAEYQNINSIICFYYTINTTFIYRNL